MLSSVVVLPVSPVGLIWIISFVPAVLFVLISELLVFVVKSVLPTFVFLGRAIGYMLACSGSFNPMASKIKLLLGQEPVLLRIATGLMRTVPVKPRFTSNQSTV